MEIFCEINHLFKLALFITIYFDNDIWLYFAKAAMLGKRLDVNEYDYNSFMLMIGKMATTMNDNL